MSVRVEAVNQLQKEGQQGEIILRRGGGKKARNRLIKSEVRFNKAREKVIAHEYATGFRLWVLGGSRYDASSPESEFTTNLTEALVSRLGIDILTGAGPGIMDAASNGLKLAKENADKNGRHISGRNLGIGLKVPWEEDRKSFDYYRDHPELMTRVQELADLSHSAYVSPGAIGTAFELWTLIQLQQAHHLENNYRLVVHPSWRKSIEDFKKAWYEERVQQGLKPTIGEDDLKIIFSDDIPEIVDIISESYNKWNESIGKHVRYRRRHFWNIF